MALNPKFIALSAGLALSGCAHFSGDAGKSRQTRESKTERMEPVPFRNFLSLGLKLSAASDIWRALREPGAESRRAVLALTQSRDRNARATLYESEFPAGEFKTKEIESALGYLFKVDPANVPPPPGFDGFRVLLPPRDTGHCGLLRLTDTDLVYLDVEGVDDPRHKGCVAEGLSFATGPERRDSRDRPARRRFLALLLNTSGLQALEDTVFKHSQYRFQEAFALDSTVPEFLANLAAIFALRHDPAGGVALLLRHPRLLDSSGQLCGVLGSFYEELSRYPEARDWALRALEKDPGDREWLINLSDALWGLGEKVQSKNVLLRPYAEKPGFRLAVYLAATYLGLEEYENALAVLEKAQADSTPTAKSSAYTLRAYLGLKRFEEGLDFIRDRGNAFPPTAENWFLKAACEFNLKLYRQALESLRQSLNLEPANREAEELQTRIAALMGGKSNQVLRTPIAALRSPLNPTLVWKWMRDSSWDARLSAYPISLLAQQVQFQWIPKGRWKKTRHAFFLVPDGGRLIRFSELTFDLNTSSTRFFINRLQVYDSTWKPVYTGTVNDSYVTKTPNSALHPENLLVHVALKRRPGRMYVEILTTEEAQVPAPEFPYLRFEHRAGYPVAYSRFEILSPPSNLLLLPFGGARFDTLPERVSVTMDAPALPPETRFAPEAGDEAAGFSASPFTTWREVAQRYLGDLRKAGVDPTKPVLQARERAAEVATQTRKDDMVRALFRYVRDSIRYDNFEFGLNASVPDSVPVVLAKRSADCKGHALLLAQMLQTRGIEAYLSLVNLERAGDVGQPHISQFNHMIVHVPRQRGLGPYFLDPTDKFSAFRRTPLDLEGRNTLILDPANPRLAAVPELDSAGEHGVKVFHELLVDKEQWAHGRDSLVLNGLAAREFREHLGSWNAASKYQNLLSWLASNYTSFNEDWFRIVGEEDPDAPLVLVLKYHSRFPYLDAARAFDYFPRLELSFLRFPEAGKRRAPVYFPHEVTVESNWTYRLPAGFGWKSLSLARELEEEYLRWRFSIQQPNPETIVLQQQWRIVPFLAEPDEYRQLRALWDPMLQKCGLRLAISKL